MANNDGKVQIHGKTYLTVAYRVNEFRKDKPDWGIYTELVSADAEIVIMKATIFDQTGNTIGTGYAEERRTSSQINKTSALENCETSAIGRALAACGYGGTEYASANEVENAIHQQNTVDKSPTVKIDPKAKKEFHEQVLKALESGDDSHMKELWSEWDADEKAVLWGMFNSQQRSTMKEMTK